MTAKENVKSTQLTEAKLPPPAARLTPAVTAAEQRVLSLVSRGWTNKEIAAALGLSPATIKRHMEKILTKLGLRNRVELAIHGITADSCPHHSTSGCALARFERDGAISR